MRAIAMAGAAAAALILAGAGPAGAALLRVTSSADAGDGSLRAALAKAHPATASTWWFRANPLQK